LLCSLLQYQGCDGNTIDGMYLQASPRMVMSRGGTRRGVVLYCAPNAGIYEGEAMMPRDKSWVGFYTSLGFDVCVWNYRGFCRSSGMFSTALYCIVLSVISLANSSFSLHIK
jgi:hypothetical protein